MGQPKTRDLLEQIFLYLTPDSTNASHTTDTFQRMENAFDAHEKFTVNVIKYVEKAQEQYLKLTPANITLTDYLANCIEQFLLNDRKDNYTEAIKNGIDSIDIRINDKIPSVDSLQQFKSALNIIASNYNQNILLRKKLLFECKSYLKYISSQANDNQNIACQKMATVKELITSLESNNSLPKQMSDFKRIFRENLPIFLKRRDSRLMTFIKAVATILSFGLAALTGIWKPKSADMAKSMANYADIDLYGFDKHRISTSMEMK